MTITQGAFELESLKEEIKGNITEQSQYTEDEYPLFFKPNFSTVFSILEFSIQEPLFSFVHNDSIRDFLGFHLVVKDEKFNLSPNPVDTLSFDNFFLETDIAQGLIFEGK